MKYHKNTIFIAISLFVFLFLMQKHIQAQLRNPSAIGLRTHNGFIIPHSKAIRSISDSYPYGIELDYSRLMLGQQAWDYCNCFPRYGFTLNYMNFDNPDTVGYSIYSVAYIEPFIGFENQLNFSSRFGTGIAYMSLPYDSISNPLNLFYSTHLTFVLTINLSINYRINPQWNIRLSANYNHISNGGLKKPNKGINYPTAGIGADYTFAQYSLPQREKVKPELYDKSRWTNIILLGTAKSSAYSDSQRKLVYGLASTYNWLVGRMNVISAGGEWVADGTLRERLQHENNSASHHRAAFLVGHNLLIGRFSFSQYLGIYVYAPYPAKDPVYQRWGLSFQLNEKVFAGLNLKAHRHVADLLDFRVGISF